jgi:adenine-specific DNA-methyltransferase
MDNPALPGFNIPAVDGLRGNPYLTKQLIAYLGNKRALLGFLADVFSELDGRHRISTFLDPFAGSGSVSRLARLMKFKVLANDWEFYTMVINTCHLTVEKRDLPGFFQDRGGIDAVVDTLNSLTAPQDGEGYISRYYSPKSTAEADYRRERLFYTAENGRRIDAIRNRIEEWYPGLELTGTAYREKMVLLSMLLYQCATHTNTSGVFKAFHRGFGGYSRDALKRIMADIQLIRPVLLDCQERSEVFSQDAEVFLKRHSSDLCYLDPPYTTHQYGSNYHMLNTVALWDKPPLNNSTGADGRLEEKAAIRKDWVWTRSDFCYKVSAPAAFSRLLDSIDARYIVLSYNTEGIVPFEQLCELLSRRGRLTLHSSDYVKYRGGKQSLSRQLHNLELLMVVDSSVAANGVPWEEIERTLLEKKFFMLLKRSYYPELIKEHFKTSGSHKLLYDTIALPMRALYRFSVDQRGREELACLFDQMSSASLKDLHSRLTACLCSDNQEEINILLRLIPEETDIRERRSLLKRMIRLFKKFAFKKYEKQFFATLEILNHTVKTESCIYGSIEGDLLRIEALARMRFEG